MCNLTARTTVKRCLQRDLIGAKEIQNQVFQFFFNFLTLFVSAKFFPFNRVFPLQDFVACSQLSFATVLSLNQLSFIVHTFHSLSLCIRRFKSASLCEKY